MNKEQIKIKEKIKFWESEIIIEKYKLEMMKLCLKNLKKQLTLSAVGCSSCEDIPKESYYPGMTCEKCNQPFRIVKNKQ